MERERRAVTATAGHFAANPDDLRHASLEISREVPVVFLVIGRRHQHLDVAADHLQRSVAEQALGPAIERLDPPFGIDHDDAVDGRVDNRPPTQFARAKRHVRAFARREVSCDGRRADDGSGRIPNRRHGQRYVDEVPVFRLSNRLVMLDMLAGFDALENGRELILAVMWEDQRHRASRDLLGRVAIEALGCAIPRTDHAIEIFADDGVVGCVDDRGQDAAGFVLRPERCHPAFS